MENSSPRRSAAGWLSLLIAAAAAPAFAQTRLAMPVEGLSGPATPLVRTAVIGGAGFVLVPALALSNAASAPSALASGPSARVAGAAPALAPAAAAASIPVLSVSPFAAARIAPASVPASPAAARAPSAATSASASVSRASRAAVSARGNENDDAAPISWSRAEDARQAAAVATIEGVTADWTARAPQALDGGSVRAAASGWARPLSKSEGASAAAAPAGVPAAPAPSKFKTVMKWAAPILAMTALATSLDFGTKLMASKFLFSVFHECAWRTPLLMAIIPFITFTAYKARVNLNADHKVWHWSVKKLGNGRVGFYRDELSGLTAMAAEHPSLNWARRIYDVSIALMLGGMLGNGIDAIRLGGALDWIPLGRSLMNLADVSLLTGLAVFQLMTHFFMKAAQAHKAGKPLYFNTGNFLGLPIAGFFIAWAFGSAQGGGALDLAMKNVGFLYLMGFSMLVGFSRFLASLVVGKFAAKFVAEEGAKAAAAPAAAPVSAPGTTA